MKISFCNSRRWFRKRYFSLRSSGLVKVNCSTEGTVAFFGIRDMSGGFVITHVHVHVHYYYYLKNYLRNIPVSYTLERYTNALRRKRTD